MDKIAYFKLQAKNLFRDFKTQTFDEEGLTRYSPRFFKDIDDIGRCEFAVFDTTSFDSEEIAVCIEGRIFKASIYDSGLSTIGRYSDSL